MGVLPAAQPDVQGEPGRRGEGPPELLGQLGIERRCPQRGGVGRELDVIGQERTTGAVKGHLHQCLVQGKGHRAEPADARLVTQRLGHHLTEGDPDVLDSVVGVDLEIPACRHGEVEPAVPAQLGDHVVEEGQPGGDLDGAGAIEVDGHLDRGLLGRPLHRGDPAMRQVWG